ncbi:type IV pilus modification PilV family protein [Photobacterium lucens]|uniref:type IV pilus modification PilV family protein n=1 Tax=Photobacterium lucens TaxID=2562949 RepID=UPI00136E4045|nr:prepilin-type N-terminal cleavage/methylation domain-containing protein [Photobacterium lucens]MBP2701949.1 prepilin-type N-terminal cleavage/methylation domain-containing protein [Vibrio parahaemolyticus]MZG55275.1 prepilin-type N-terminal cleavage/methylation domain-containing protein [Photobacterium lucens]MZG79218.1 prepilin-type N-terminal cleavage/methylation domain-containing protein [Photobacterium lucens]
MIYKIPKGFSLLEVVISLAVLSIGVLGLVKMQAYMEVKSENALKTLDALYLAEKKLELFQTRSQSGGSGTIPYSSIISSPSEAIPISGITMTRKITVINNEPVSGAKKINVIVSWQDRRDVTQNVSLDTVISKYSEFD